jgi:hypothetical protein
MTCLETFATLRIFSQSMDPETISSVLGIDATDSAAIDPKARARNRREWHRWEWCSRDSVQGVDNLLHIRAVTRLLQGKKEKLDELRSSACGIDICCYFVSSGQGGPELDVPTLRELTELELEIWWDVYFGKEEEYKAPDE